MKMQPIIHRKRQPLLAVLADGHQLPPAKVLADDQNVKPAAETPTDKRAKPDHVKAPETSESP
jgi:hypothetical protein